jgi:Zn finger protein HypA/HybF involved in hydrogenase expression
MGTTGDNYFPSWMEFAVSAGVVSAMVIVFLFAIEKFNIWEQRPEEPETAPHTRPQFSRGGEVWLGAPGAAARTKYSLAFVMAMAIGFAIMPGQKIHSSGVASVPTFEARGGDTLFVDGNRDGYGVSFKHQFHIDTLGGKASCIECHHMNVPADRQSGCYKCHADMYQVVDAFGHDWHSSPTGGNIACRQCHTPGLPRTAETAKKCDACHTDLVPIGAHIAFDSHWAPSYADAMHGLCVSCHSGVAAQDSTKQALAQCATCHGVYKPDYLQADVAGELAGPYFNHVVLPGAHVYKKTGE